MIGRADLSADDRLNSMGGRGRNRELAESVIRPWLEPHTAAEICELGELFRVPVAFVGNGRDVLDDVALRRARRVRRAPEASSRRARRSCVGSPCTTSPRTASAPTTTRPLRRSRRSPAAPRMQARPLAGVTVLDLTAFWAGPRHPPARHARRRRGEDRVARAAPTACASPPCARRPSPTGWSTAPPSTAPTPGSAPSPSTSRRPRDASWSCASWSTPTWWWRTSRRACCRNVGLDVRRPARTRRPDLIMLRMPAFGLDGPWRDRSGFAQTTEQVSGIAWMTGDAGDRAASPLHRRPDRRYPRRVRGAGRAGAPRAYGRGAAARDADGRGGAERRRRADRHLVGVRHVARARGQSRRARRAAGRVRVRGRRAVGRALDRDRRRVARAWCRCSANPRGRRDPDAGDRRGPARTPRRDRRRARRRGSPARDRDDAVGRLLAAGVLAAPVWDQKVQDALPQLAAARLHPVARSSRRRARRLPRHRRARRRSSTTALPRAGAHGRPAHHAVLHELGLTDDEIAALPDSGVV